MSVTHNPGTKQELIFLRVDVVTINVQARHPQSHCRQPASNDHHATGNHDPPTRLMSCFRPLTGFEQLVTANKTRADKYLTDVVVLWTLHQSSIVLFARGRFENHYNCRLAILNNHHYRLQEQRLRHLTSVVVIASPYHIYHIYYCCCCYPKVKA